DTDSGNINLTKGDVVFVRAGCEHRFLDIKDRLVILAVFPKAMVTQDMKGFIHYTSAQVEQQRDPNQNAWNPFLRSRSMVFGLYMLPKKIGGDSTLTHQVDELN